MHKRILTVTALVILSAMLFSACSKKDETPKPTDINVNGKTISYYSNKEKTEKILALDDDMIREVGNVIAYGVGVGTLQIIYDEEGNIRWLYILDRSIKTYNDISLFDDESKVTEAYKYEKVSDDKIEVLFSGSEEVEWNSTDDIADDQIIIKYFCHEGMISGIMIYDGKFETKGD